VCARSSFKEALEHLAEEWGMLMLCVFVVCLCVCVCVCVCVVMCMCDCVCVHETVSKRHSSIWQKSGAC